MADYSQIPGELNIEVGYGDEFVLALDFDIDLSGYTFVSKVIKAELETETDIVVSGTNLSAGQLSLFLTEADITTLEEAKHRWYLFWTPASGVGRRALAGYFEIKKYPP